MASRCQFFRASCILGERWLGCPSLGQEEGRGCLSWFRWGWRDGYKRKSE